MRETWKLCALYLKIKSTAPTCWASSISKNPSPFTNIYHDICHGLSCLSFLSCLPQVLMGDQNAFCSCGIISHDAESIALSVLDIVSKVGVEILLVAMKVTSYATPAIAIGIAINGTVAVQVAAGGGAH